MYLVTSAVAASLLAPLVAGHALIISAQGLKDGKAAGPMGMAMGYERSVPLNGDQRHVPIFNQRSMGTWNGCGQNILAGVLGTAKWLPNQANRGEIAQATAGGQLFLVLHQVNGDGNGPFTCGIDTSATAARGKFKKIDIFRQVPGANPDLNAVATTNHPLIVNIPPDITCEGKAGTKENVCLIRCQNFAINGPFGSCVAFQLVEELRANFKRSLSDGPEPDKDKAASDSDIDKLMSRFDTSTKVKREDGPAPENATPPTDADINKLMSRFDTTTKRRKLIRRQKTSETEKVEDTTTALTQGDDVPPVQLERLKALVKSQIRNGTLPSKAEKAGEEVTMKKKRLRQKGFRGRKND
ncbi:hypothetical protein TWF730_000576 [Orbilia blumenaviensis]|uniref:Uncharacterized protein n=1 Tax=Orbilia blumenaviensis TaxID=1796055 RepID=A0AAV9VNZ0_9PEZI